MNWKLFKLYRLAAGGHPRSPVWTRRTGTDAPAFWLPVKQKALARFLVSTLSESVTATQVCSWTAIIITHFSWSKRSLAEKHERSSRKMFSSWNQTSRIDLPSKNLQNFYKAKKSDDRLGHCIGMERRPAEAEKAGTGDLRDGQVVRMCADPHRCLSWTKSKKTKFRLDLMRFEEIILNWRSKFTTQLKRSSSFAIKNSIDSIGSPVAFYRLISILKTLQRNRSLLFYENIFKSPNRLWEFRPFQRGGDILTVL